jgi:tetratricopeptide (TPR) repeat protein
MKRLSALIGGAILAALVAADARAMDATIRQSDMGAGPIVARMTACLVANRSHRGTPCPEPEVSQASDNTERVANRLARVWYFIDTQDFDKARMEIDLALGIDPADLTARHLSARLALTVGDLPRAEADLAIARKQAPDDPDIHSTYAVMLESKPADLEALREFGAVIRTHPDHVYARQEAARLLVKFGHFDVALENLNVVVERRPTVNVLVQRSETFLALGKPQSAAADLSAAMKIEPGQFMLMVARGDAYAAAGLSDLALRDYDTVLAVDHGAPLYVMFDNDRAKVLAKRANVYIQLKRFDDAARDMATAIGVGGVPAILRAQVLLRRNGFGDVPLDGHDSPQLRQALSACFGLDVCFHGIMRAI